MTEHFELPADWRERVANHMPALAGENPPYGLNGMIAEIESWSPVPAEVGDKPALPPFVLRPALRDPETTNETDEDGECLFHLGQQLGERLTAEAGDSTADETADFGGCDETGFCPERLHRPGCLTTALTDTELANGVVPPDAELQGRLDLLSAVTSDESWRAYQDAKRALVQNQTMNFGLAEKLRPASSVRDTAAMEHADDCMGCEQIPGAIHCSADEIPGSPA